MSTNNSLVKYCLSALVAAALVAPAIGQADYCQLPGHYLSDKHHRDHKKRRNHWYHGHHRGHRLGRLGYRHYHSHYAYPLLRRHIYLGYYGYLD